MGEGHPECPQRLDAIEDRLLITGLDLALDIDYTVETGKKYHKVILVNGGGSRSVHCFIDKNTGEVYKSASYKAPAKGVRFDLRLIKDREYLFANADWSGGYLYAR